MEQRSSKCSTIQAENTTQNRSEMGGPPKRTDLSLPIDSHRSSTPPQGWPLCLSPHLSLSLSLPSLACFSPPTPIPAAQLKTGHLSHHLHYSGGQSIQTCINYLPLSAHYSHLHKDYPTFCSSAHSKNKKNSSKKIKENKQAIELIVFQLYAAHHK